MTLAVSRRRLLVGALGATGLALVAACGGSAAPTAAPVKTEPKPAAEPTKPAAGAAPTTASTGAAPTAPTPTIPAGAKVVTFWIPWGQPERQKWVLETGETFRAKNPDQALKMEF